MNTVQWKDCGGKMGSDWWRAVADLHVEFVRRLGKRRLLQHFVLHDDFLVGIYWGVCVVRVVPWLISTRLIGWLRTQRLFTLAPQQLAKESKQDEDTFKTDSQGKKTIWNKPLKESMQRLSPHLKLGVAVRCLFRPFISSGEKSMPLSVWPSCQEDST